MINYLIQLLIFQALFLGAYELFLKKETFFSLNRVYLLVTPFLAALLPFLEIGVLQTFVPFQNMVELPAVFIGEAVIPSPSTSLRTGSVDVTPSAVEGFFRANWLLLLYSAGVLTSLVLFLRKYLHLKKLIKSASVQKIGENRVFEIRNSRMACTFFNRIFLGSELSENEKTQILEHERVHVNQKHTWDLLLFEMLRIVLWFNPFIYRQQRQLSLLHEYIADAAVTKITKKTTYFQNLLNATFQTREVSFINQFFTESLTKKRIKMMQKPKSNRNAKLKYLLVFPLMLAMLTYVGCSQDNPSDKAESQLDKTEKVRTIEIEAFKFLNSEKEAAIVKEIQKIGTEYDKVIVTDGNQSLLFNQPNWAGGFIDQKKNGFCMRADKFLNSDGFIPPPPPPGPPSLSDINEIPFSIIDQVPIFPGCENFTSNEAQKMCMSKKIAEFVNTNFDTSLSKKLGLKNEKIRIQVMFKIDETGKVVEVKTHSEYPSLQDEAVRVVSSLPDMKPGKHLGRPVKVLYSLPIIFQVD